MEDRLFRALAVLRIVLTVNMVALNFYRRDNFDHPTAAVVAVLALAVWTIVAIWAYADRARRTATLLVVDLSVAWWDSS